MESVIDIFDSVCNALGIPFGCGSEPHIEDCFPDTISGWLEIPRLTGEKNVDTGIKAYDVNFHIIGFPEKREPLLKFRKYADMERAAIGIIRSLISDQGVKSVTDCSFGYSSDRFTFDHDLVLTMGFSLKMLV